MGNFEKVVASSKLAHMEKYGFTYEEDLGVVQKYLDAQVQPIDRDKARVSCQGRTFDVTIRRDAGTKKSDYKPGSIIEC